MKTLEYIRPILNAAMHTALWIIKIVVPTSLAVSLLDFYGVITYIAHFFSPLFHHIGLRGEASVAYISSLFLPLYAPIAIMSQMGLNLREVSILGLMCLLAHSLPIESSVQHRIGFPAWASVPLRISFSLLCGLALNLAIPDHIAEQAATLAATAQPAGSVAELLSQWGAGTLSLCLKIIVIIFCLMIVQDILKRTGAINRIAHTLSPLMKILGLKSSSAFLWLTAQIVGLSYGAGIMEQELRDSSSDKTELTLLNSHIAVNHSLLEDSTLFCLMGVSWYWIVIPRLVSALIVVWTIRLFSRRAFLKAT